MYNTNLDLSQVKWIPPIHIITWWTYHLFPSIRAKLCISLTLMFSRPKWMHTPCLKAWFKRCEKKLFNGEGCERSVSKVMVMFVTVLHLWHPLELHREF
jgi:hypothetical protein